MSIVSLSKCYDLDGITPKQDCFVLTNVDGEPIYVDKSLIATIVGCVISAGKAGGQTIKGGTAANDDLKFIPTSGNASSTSMIQFWTGSNGSVHGFSVFNSGNIGMGTESAGLGFAKLNIIKAGTQLKVGYDNNNYFTVAVDSVGNTVFDAAIPGARFKFLDKINIPTQTPISATDAGEAGDIAWDSDFFYTCVATNNWKRTPLTSW